MKPLIISACILSCCMIIDGCSDTTSLKIKRSLSQHYNNTTGETNKALKILAVDSISYSPADSTVYYDYILSSLSGRSESFSRMAKLRTSLAQGHINDFLTGNNNANTQSGKNKSDLDKSLEALKENEREWDVINDSMDLVLNAMHTTDTTRKTFYKVSYILKSTVGDEKPVLTRGDAILNINDFKIVFAQ